MSYDIKLCDPITAETIEIDEPHFIRGGTYQMGGCTELWLNITYNYADYYYDATQDDERFIREDNNGGIRGIYGKTGAESIPMLSDMINRIKAKYQDESGNWIRADEGDTSDYWQASAANAIRPLYQLLAFAKMRPDGIWKGD